LIVEIELKEKNQKYRILLVVPYTIPDYSGSGINAFQLARFLNREGERATLLTFNRNLKLKAKEIIDGVPIRRIAYFNRNMLTKILSIFIIFPAYLVNILRHDIILIYGAHVIGYQLIISSGRFFRKKIIFRSLMMDTDDLKSILNSKQGSRLNRNRSVFDKISLYFAINPVFAEIYRKQVMIQQKVVVSPQGFDPEYFHPVTHDEHKKSRENHQIDKSSFIIVSVGFLIPRKGYNEIFEILAELDFSFNYYIVGEHEFNKDHFLSEDAAEAFKIKEYGQELLGNRLHLEGAKKQVLDYYQMADLVIFNSRQEGISNALLESMACGKPVLCRDIPGLRDYIIYHEQNGLLFDKGQEMRTWIEKIYRNPVFAEGIGTRAADFVHMEANFMIVWKRLLEGLYGNQK
jgi:glycosyltransferase involved in cell wall biosynthesis